MEDLIQRFLDTGEFSSLTYHIHDDKTAFYYNKVGRVLELIVFKVPSRVAELLVLLSINMVIDPLSSDVVINWKNILYRWKFDSIINERKITPK